MSEADQGTNPDREVELAAELRALEERFGKTFVAVTTEALTVRELVRDRIQSYESADTGRTYQTHFDLLCDGFTSVCNQTCEPCMEEREKGHRFACGCTCRACRDSAITLEAQGALLAGPSTLNARNFELVVKAAERMAVKRGVLDNRGRARRGLPAKRASGKGGRENAVSALRSLFTYALTRDCVSGDNPAKAIPKPRRAEAARRAVADFELVDLYDLTATGGDDPRLDVLLVDFGLESGARRKGAYLFTMAQIKPKEQLLEMKDKYGIPQDVPVSAELIERMLAHARERGGAQCTPGSPEYRPDTRVFWYKQRGRENYAPITSRRFDTLHGRWQSDLPWGAEIGISYHYLRHTIAEILKARYGPHYAQRYLRHTDNAVTDTYGRCTTEMLARAMGEIFGYEHPLVSGRDAERARVLRLHLGDNFG